MCYKECLHFISLVLIPNKKGMPNGTYSTMGLLIGYLKNSLLCVLHDSYRFLRPLELQQHVLGFHNFKSSLRNSAEPLSKFYSTYLPSKQVRLLAN